MNNLCRTCKFWTARDHFVGLGFCSSIDVCQMTLLNHQPESPIWTSQDFGCVCHETGERNIPSLYSPDKQTRIWMDFLNSKTKP